MKLIDAIRLVKRPEADNSWVYSAPIEDCCTSLGIAELWNYSGQLDARFKSYPILSWICTDTHVGLYALYLDGEPVGCTIQNARKNGLVIKWLSEEAAKQVRDVLLSYNETQTFDLVNPEEDIGEDFAVEYVGQALSDDGFYEGRPVRALVWYDGLMGHTTPPKYRREGKAYTEAVPYDDPKSNCVLVQDGDEQRVIPIEEFRLALNVGKPA